MSKAQIITGQKELSEALKRVANAVGSFGISSGILFNSNNGLEIMGTNLEIGIRMNIEAQGRGRFVADKKIADIISKMPSGEAVRLEAQGNNLNIKSDKQGSEIKFRIGLFDNPEDYPVPEEVSEPKAVTLNSYEFLQSLKRVSFCIPKNSKRPFLIGAFFETEEETSKVKITTTDTRRMAHIELGAESLDGSGSWIVPDPTVNVLEKELKLSTGNTHAVFGTKRIKFEIEKGEDSRTTVYSRVIDGEYPDYTHFIPRGNEKKIVFTTDQMDQALSRLLLIDDVVIFEPEEDVTGLNLAMESKSNNGETAAEVIEPIQIEGDLSEFGLDGNYFSQALKAVKGRGDVEFRMNGSLDPMLIPETDDDSYCHVLMPIRIE